jgi:hypothetical protein
MAIKLQNLTTRFSRKLENTTVQSRIPIINRKQMPDMHFTTIKYVFSNDATRKRWEGKLIQEIGSPYLKVWSPQDKIEALSN